MTERAEKADAETEKNGTLTEKGEKNGTTMAKNGGGSDTALTGSPGTSQSGSLIVSFKAFSKFGDSKSDGRFITLSQSDKWMKQAKVIDGKTITTTDTAIYFKKHKSTKLGLDQYKSFLEDLAKGKKVDLEEMKKKMANCGAPGLSTGLTGLGKAASTVDRLTDVSKYTGSHKQRFDESGRGRGIAGRKDLADDSGYVQGYQNKDTYNKGGH